MDCNSCGKNMTTPDEETSFIGVKIEVILDDCLDEATKEWYIKQMKPFQVNRQYHVCFPCWLRGLGVQAETSDGI